VKLGVNIGYWGLDMLTQGGDRLAHEVEALGFDSLWAAEAYGCDGPSVLATLARGTERIGLGSAVFQVPARAPAMTAMTAATLDRLSAGRFRLGLGLSSAQVTEGWYGQPFASPLARLEDYVAVVRRALSRERLSYEGRTIRLPAEGSTAPSIKLMIGPVQESLPIYLAAVGPKAVELVGRIGDGWHAAFFCPDFADSQVAHLRKGAAAAGRDVERIDIAPTVNLWIDDDHDRARDRLRHSLALYIGGMGSRTHNVYADLVASYGFERDAARIQDLYLAGKKDEAASAIPAELIDLVVLCGPPSVVGERMEAYAKAGVTTLIVSPATSKLGEYLEQLARVARLAHQMSSS
jgi:F420-dependent oxidoreductase-like protein